MYAWERLKIVLAAGLFLACEEKTGAVQAGAVNAPAAPQASEQRAVQWIPGHRYEYRFSLSSTASVSAGSGTSLHLSGRLVLFPRAPDREAREIGLDVRELRASGDAASKVAGDALITKLDQAFSFTLRTGRITGFRVAKAADAESVNTLRTLASAFQCSEPVTPSASWTAEEFDSTGKYVAEYRQANGVIAKRKLRYSALTFGGTGISVLGGGLPAPEVKASEGKLLGRDGTLHQLSFLDELALPFEGAKVTSTTSASFELVREDRSSSFDWRVLEQQTRPLSPHESFVGPPRPTAAFDAQRIGTFTFETALIALENVSRESPHAPPQDGAKPLDEAEQVHWMRDSERAFTAMAAILRTQPVHLARTKRAMKSNSPAAPWLADALAAAGTDEAQAVLVGLVRDRQLKSPLRVSAVRSLIRTERASEATLDWLIQASADPLLGEIATYGLGSVARRLREAGLEARSARATRELIDRLARASGTSAKISVLRGLANAGDVAAFEPVQSALRDPDPRLRAAAVEALRLMKDPRIDAIIATHLKDTDARVRVAALAAAKVRTPSDLLANRVKELMLSDAETKVRGRAIRLATTWLRHRPELRSVLELVAERDVNAKLRETAKEALGA
jgi:hypothetical protein